jgi:hypothetical protein
MFHGPGIVKAIANYDKYDGLVPITAIGLVMPIPHRERDIKSIIL